MPTPSLAPGRTRVPGMVFSANQRETLPSHVDFINPEVMAPEDVLDVLLPVHKLKIVRRWRGDADVCM